ncbi:MAG: M28 family peptidase [Balneolaceae bacterium]|nr:M28 family peptidase [Balneolaceae bacterium]
MKLFRALFTLSAIALFTISCSSNNAGPKALSPEITSDDILKHISFLADDTLKGRQAGTPGEVRSANYIADHFANFGLVPAGNNDTYFQEFTINMNMLNNPHSNSNKEFKDQEHIARNVAGIIKGTEQPNQYIVIGAHYDHLGYGDFGSLYNRDTTSIHNGADDNASGTAGVLELAQYFNRHPIKKSILFLAFSAEEMGLLGSQHYVENPTIELDNALAMINMDMIGRMAENKLLIFGTGSADRWSQLIEEANTDSITINTVPDGTGASDHTSFYNKQIPVLHYFTDTHADYHRPSDDTEYINGEGTDKVLEHVKRMVVALDNLTEDELTYTEAPVTQNRDVTMSGVTLGVTPDYGFDGNGMRITGVRGGGAADSAGLQGGDVIIKLANKDLKDIYAYMEILNTLEEGQTTTVTVLRDGSEQTFEIEL